MYGIYEPQGLQYIPDHHAHAEKNAVGAINWGFVAGKTNTIYAWDQPIRDGSEPSVWFHDILRKDGTPFSIQETATIKALTAKPLCLLQDCHTQFHRCDTPLCRLAKYCSAGRRNVCGIS